LRVKPFPFVLAVLLILKVPGLVQATDPARVLQVTSERLLDDLKRMPRYTCVQTITRTYYTSNQFGHPSCSKLIAEHDARKKPLPVQSWDRLRLEVALVEGGSVYSWVGAPRFTDDTLDKLAGSGPLGSGDFGVFLSGILHHATLNFQGERTNDGTRLLEYSYEMPVGKSGYRVKVPNGWAVTGYDGTLLLDPETNDLVKLVVRTNELPSASLACRATSEVTYRRTPIHQKMVLVPHETKLYTIGTTGAESMSETSYANCREYSSTIKMMFGGETITSDPAPASNPNPAPAPVPALPLPAGLHFSVHITTPIDIVKAAAGDPIEAVLTAPMHDEKKAVVASAGAHLHGRLRTVKVWNAAWNTVQIGIQFESIEIEGRNVPVNAISQPVRPLFIPAPYGMRFARTDDSFIGGTFFFNDVHIHDKDLDSEWITVKPDEQKKEKSQK
jgi:hypothetical protein